MMSKATTRTTSRLFLCFAILSTLLLMTAAPAGANDKGGRGGGHSGDRGGQSQGKDHDGDADSDSKTSYNEDNDTNDDNTPNNVEDDGDNKHPSGKDRSSEHGRSGTQGKAESDPDDDGRGPDRSNGGPDKPNGSGGHDKADQDGNNGCGNDDDFEDDNEGWCGTKPRRDKERDDEVKGKSEDRSSPGGGTQGGNLACPSGTTTYKIDANPGTGTFSDGTLSVTISGNDGDSFSWSSNMAVKSVIVKGGPASEVNAGGTSGFAQAPFNPHSGKLYGISHVSFCYTPGDVVVADDDEVCPAGTDMAGQEPGPHGCNLPKTEVCPAGTDMAGLPPGTDGCNVQQRDDEVKPNIEKRCPAGTDDAGQVMDSMADCDEDDVLPQVIRDAAQPLAQAARRAAAVLPFTGAGDLMFGAALGLLLIALGAVGLKLRKS